MASLRQIAKLAGVSPGTASFVLNGKGEQYRISASTQQKVLEVAQELNYKPNISARRLRSGGEKVLPIIALFWTLDTRAKLIGRYLNALQIALEGLEQEYELLIQPYENGKLSEVASLQTGTRFNGAIIANLSEEDQSFLEQAKLNVPIVIYQRNSTKYTCVNVDSLQTGAKVAEHFQQHGHQRLGLIVPDNSSHAIFLRKEGFIRRARELGLQLAEEHIVYESFSEAGGYAAIDKLLNRPLLPQQSQHQQPTALFVLSDQMAVGCLRALQQHGRRVPEDLELIGHDNDAVSEFTVPSLSTVHLPVEEMAAASISLLDELIQHKTEDTKNLSFDTQLVIRESCRG